MWKKLGWKFCAFQTYICVEIEYHDWKDWVEHGGKGSGNS